MTVDLSDAELALCIGALEHAAKDFREGAVASERLGYGNQDGLTQYAGRMDALKSKLLAHGQSQNE